MKIPNTTTYAQMGMAALLPGMVHAHKLLGEEIERVRKELAVLQNGASYGDAPAVTGASPDPALAPRTSGWSTDPAERSAEMKRRVRKAKLRKAALARWEGLSVRKQKEHVAKMVAGRFAKQKEANA